MKKRLLYTLLLMTCFICFIISGYQLISYGLHALRTHQLSDELSQLIAPNDHISIDAQNETSLSEEERMREKYGKLYEKNQDFAGWLQIEGTSINYPVMHTPVDPEHYLRRNFNGDNDITGTLFVDGKNSLQPLNTNTTIYGHRMKDGTMFGSLGKYKEADFLSDHPVIHFDTLYAEGLYQIFAVALIDASTHNTSCLAYYNWTEPDDELFFHTFMNELEASSLFYLKDDAPEFGDSILTLSTCDYYTENGRLVIFSKRIPN